VSQHPAPFVAQSSLTAAEAVPELRLAPPSLDVAAPARQRLGLRRALMLGAGALALVGAAYFGWRYWTVGQYQVSTDDAYVQADNTTIAPKISGYIGAVVVEDNQPVKAGQVLARIDDRDFRVALDQARAEVQAAEAAIASKTAALGEQQAAIAAARAAVEVDQANLTFAGQENKRYASLAATGYGSVQNAQLAASRIAASRATMARDAAALEAAERRIDVLKADVAEATATRARDVALERQAELNLSYATIVSPVDGVVGARSLRVGQYVQAGSQLMAIVPVGSVYVVANYKETQLAQVRAGEEATVEVDTYPGQVFHGRVDSVAAASGQEFALLPPDNATGNFTKIVQRIPVKIVLDPARSPVAALRPGMSVYPTIDTRALAAVASNR
jgi:membrane fusion protein (multidrug efflux system)